MQVLRRAALFSLCLALLVPAPAPGQDTRAIEKQLKTAYLGKVLTIRGFYGGDKLVYDTDGNLTKGGKPGSWTLTGRIEVTGIELKTDRLEVLANRLWLLYDRDKKEFQRLRSKNKVHIEVSLDKESASLARIVAAFDQMFLWNDERMLDEVADFWKPWLTKRLPKGEQDPTVGPVPDLGGDKPAYRAGGGVTAPVCLSCGDPKYSKEARDAKIGGVVVLWVFVSEEGVVDDVRIAAPIGMGLDEQAVEAIRQWRFRPATRFGKPVPVRMAVEINFNLFD